MSNQTPTYPKRLIEVDLPIARISTHARREKSIRHGHISTLHIWWARRPLAACRAVICASLWPDPADELCPLRFRKDAFRILTDLKTRVLEGGISPDQRDAFESVSGMSYPKDETDLIGLRKSLLDFIAEFANWDRSTNKFFLETSRALTQSAHEALGGEPGTRPLVVDPFAGGGSIPLEALRVGADAFASDINPVPVLLNKVVLEYIPKYGQRLADEVRKWGKWIKSEAENELSKFYPNDADGTTPIAFLWARTIQCEGPDCGAEVPLIRSLWLAKKANRSIALQLVPNKKTKRVDFQIIVKQRDGWVNQNDTKEKIADPKFDGTVKRGSATCPCCGYTTQVARVREQLKSRRGGANDARLFCVVVKREAEQGRFYRSPTKADSDAVAQAANEMERRNRAHDGSLSLVPNETLPLMSGVFNVPIYGMTTWGDLYSQRQLLALTTLVALAQKATSRFATNGDQQFPRAVQTIVGLAISRFTDICNALCMWETTKTQVRHVFTRQALGMLWDFAEPQIFADAAGNFSVTLDTMLEVIERLVGVCPTGIIQQASAASHPLPADSADALITDPPYYNAVPYADLSDFFYVWLRRTLHQTHPDIFLNALSPKEEEVCEMSGWDPDRYFGKDAKWFELQMGKAMSEGRRVLKPSGVGIVVFAHKSTAGWEAQLQAMINAGWIVTGSWPIDTELGNRLRAQGSAALASSVHLVCRPRENPDGSVRTDEIGDWRDVLHELPRRIHEWMPRLAEEGVVGADAIFACLGPALEVFSRYSRVEKSNGDVVPLREYLEHVWAAVSNEALSMIFKDADAAGLEPDARLTAMWLWTLSASTAGDVAATSGEDRRRRGERRFTGP